MSTITSPRRSGSVRGIEGGVEKLLAAFKKKSENNINQRPFVPRRVATAPVSRRIHHQRERVVHPERNSAPARAESMATLTSSSIVSPRRSGSIRGVEGSVEKLLASFEKKTDNFDHSPLMRRIKSVSYKAITVTWENGDSVSVFVCRKKHRIRKLERKARSCCT